MIQRMKRSSLKWRENATWHKLKVCKLRYPTGKCQKPSSMWSEIEEGAFGKLNLIKA